MRLDWISHRLGQALRLPAGLLIWLSASAALACSTVVLGLPDRPVVAYSFDFASTGAGFVVVNPAPATRHSVMGDDRAQWTARHGSVTFNQIGPGMPAAGMNTAGLVVSLMWNDEAAYDRRGTRPVVNELEFIQRLLDTSGSIEEALAAAKVVRIHGIVPIHFLLADRAGATAVVTPTSTGLLVHTGDDLPVPALTNTSYAQIVERIEVFEGFGGDEAMPSPGGTDDPGSFERFVLAAAASRGTGSLPTTNHAFDVLDDLANRETRWQIVFDPELRQIAFRIAGEDDVHQVDLQRTDFRCRDYPFAAELTDLSHSDFSSALSPIDPADLRNVLGEVFASIRQTAAMGPEAADGLAAGLLASVTCS